MAGEAAQSPSQVRKDGRWRPIRHNTAPSIRSYPSGSIPPRRSSLRAFARRGLLAPIQESRTSSIKAHGSGSLEDLISTYHPTSWRSSSEQLVLISESPQLQQIQSVSLSFSEESWRHESAPSLYRTQSQWTRLPLAYRVPSGTPAIQSSSSLEGRCIPTPEDALPPETSDILDADDRDFMEIEAKHVCSERHLPREDIAELFQRVEGNDRENPEIVRESGKIWVRVNSVSRSLSKTFKTMGSLHKKKPSFEARLNPNVRVHSRLKCYEKPGQMKRIKIVVQDCWRKFRNWSTGRDTALQAEERASTTAQLTMNVSVVSLNMTSTHDTRAPPGQKGPSIAPKLERGWEAIAYRRHARKDSKHSTYDEPLKRRRSSMFLDAYPTDDATFG